MRPAPTSTPGELCIVPSPAYPRHPIAAPGSNSVALGCRHNCCSGVDGIVELQIYYFTISSKGC